MEKIHAKIIIKGIVQGVGFRPFILRRAEQFGLFGKVSNTSFGVELFLEGEKQRIISFLDGIRKAAPERAHIEKIDVTYSGNLLGYDSFVIAKSDKKGSVSTLVSPDIAVCDSCLYELFSKDNKRYLYPFINCTNCGPRFSITRVLPYDRINTTMSHFKMCDSCSFEYNDTENRRFHAQPNCCADCGPKLSLIDKKGKVYEKDVINLAINALSKGKIVAVKGIGGIHFAVRCDMSKSIEALRKRKHREEKPFAIMCRDIAAAEEMAEVSGSEKKLLTSPQRPIVLLKKKSKDDYLSISENGYIGVMLPYTPLHYLLFSGDIKSLVMTSANLSDLPIAYKDSEADSKIFPIADYFLTNNREIYARCDDSLLWDFRGSTYFVRRSRGFCPSPLNFDENIGEILACGAEQKASFCLSKDNHVFPSAHIGDLKNLETLGHYEEQINHLEKILNIKPRAIVCDMHPDYLSSLYAENRAKNENLPIFKVWHHHAHMASCMADNNITGSCIGVVWDGVGIAPSGDICGGEFLVGDYNRVCHAGTIFPVVLPGGDASVKEISRTGISLLEAAGVSSNEIFGEVSHQISKLISSKVNCPKTSSMGRLFDGVAAIIGIKHTAGYEGQGAMLLEAAAQDNTDKIYPFDILQKNSKYVFDWRKMIKEIAADVINKRPTGEIAAAFMNTLVLATAEITKKISTDFNVKDVVLSGGCFQNMYVLHRLYNRLLKEGLNVYTHKNVSTNDEGISLGQILIASKGGVSYVPCDTFKNNGN